MKTEFDYIVVGGGSAGCTLANRLSADPKNEVLLLEAGKMDNDILIRMPGGMLEIFGKGLHQWNAKTVPQKALNGRQLGTITGKALGGSSSINAMLHIRGTAKDYNRWAEEYGCDGWNYDSVLPYFRSTETNTNGANDQRGGSGELNVMTRDQELPSGKVVKLYQAAAAEVGVPKRDDFCDGEAEGVGWTQACIKDGKRHSTAQAFIRPIMKERKNLTVVAQALTQKVHFNTSGDEPLATGITYIRKGKEVTVTANKEVILTAGALRSPQLLQVSGVGDKNHLQNIGVDVVADIPAVGENLHDHPTLKVPYRLNEPISMANIGIMETLSIGIKWLFTKKGIGSWNHFDSNMFIRSTDFVESDVQLDEADVQIQMIPIIAEPIGDPQCDEHGVTFLVCLLAEKSRGNLKISSPDMAVQPDIDLAFMTNEEDFEPVKRGIRFVRKLAKAEAWGGRLYDEFRPGLDCESDEDLTKFIRSHVDNDYHYGGTCCMGNPENESVVVDPRLRVKGIKGLRVADASVMPVPMHGNTNHACVMIGAKAADMILEDNS